MAKQQAWPRGESDVASSLNRYAHSQSGPFAESSSTPHQPFRPEMVSSTSGGRNHDGEAPPTVMNRSNPAFLNKLQSMVDDPKTDEFIRWSPAGDTFLVPNHVKFGDEVLPCFFKHNNFSSFVRQLNMYGFHKVPHLQQGALKHEQPSQNELWEFSHPYFLRDKPELLSKVQRKRSGKERDQASAQVHDETPGMTAMSNALTRGDFHHSLGDPNDMSGAVTPVQLNNLMAAIQGIKNNQRTLIDEISQLQHSSQALWQQGLENRQQTRRQQDTINRILRFMSSVFGSSNVGDMLQNQSADASHATEGQTDKDMRFTPHNSAMGTPKQAPVRPPKRPRLLIGHSGNVDEPMDDGEVEENQDHDGDFSRFTEANSDNESSPPNTWSQISERNSPDSAKDTPNRSSQSSTPRNGNRIVPQTPLQSSQALVNALSTPGENNAWLSSLLASQSPENQQAGRFDPQVLAALQNALADSANGSADGSQVPDLSALNIPNTAQGAWPEGDVPNGMTQWAQNAMPSHALVPSPRPNHYLSTQENTNNAFPLPEEQFAQDVQRVNRGVQSSADQTAKLQNSINQLVQGLRLDPNAPQPNAAKPAMPVEPAAHAGMSNMALPSSYVASTQAPAAPSPGASGDFDLDSFLNQFVDPMSAGGSGQSPFPGATPSPLHGNTPTPMPEDHASDSVTTAPEEKGTSS